MQCQVVATFHIGITDGRQRQQPRIQLDSRLSIEFVPSLDRHVETLILAQFDTLYIGGKIGRVSTRIQLRLGAEIKTRAPSYRTHPYQSNPCQVESDALQLRLHTIAVDKITCPPRELPI